MPSKKPFVIAYIDAATSEALRREAQILTELAAFYRSEGFAAPGFGVPWHGVQPGQVAVVQIQDALARWPSLGRLRLSTAPRPVRQRWLLEPELHASLQRCARTSLLSFSDLAARMVQPLDARRSRASDIEGAGLQFVPPLWAQAIARERDPAVPKGQPSGANGEGRSSRSRPT